ncbi:MAG: hypothetical protein L0Y66_09945 [Myxococcaceae bacterium]|nr:hypothetical protein [Myxococcaceae bacterium]MCI0670604.1 hypothetical protein [Myxococcaceae bacterium]
MSQTFLEHAASGAVHETVEKHLEPLLGDFTAKMSVRTAALRALQRPPEQVTLTDAPALLEGLRPILNTFVGVERARSVLDELSRKVGR